MLSPPPDIGRLTNTQVRLAARPIGLPTRADWDIVQAPVAPPPDGGVLVQTLYLSLDPAMRGWMNEGKSYIAPVGLGEVMRAGGIGRVIASGHAGFGVGDLVSGGTGVQRYASFAASDLQRQGVFRIDPRLGTPTQWLNVLGMPGMTAYFGLFDVGQPQPGDTVVVSGAAGAVGQTVGQLAKIKGCRVVGIAGGPAKCRWVVDELGFDACIDYKASAPAGATRWDAVRDGLKQHCPDGVDVYFDNVGGDILDAVLARPAAQGAHRDLRRDQPVQHHLGREGPGQLPLAAGEPRPHGGHRRVRLHRAFPGGRRRDGRLPEGRPHEEQGGRRRRPRDLPRGLAQALQRRELRQAGAAGRRGLNAPASPRLPAPPDAVREALFAQSRELLVASDGQGRIVWANTRFAELTGWADCVGAQLPPCLCADDGMPDPALQRRITGALGPGGHLADTVVQLNPPPRGKAPLWLRLTIGPAGALRVWTMTDVGAERAERLRANGLEAHLAERGASSATEASAQLELAIDLARVTIWRHDLRTDRIQYNPRGFEVLGLPYRAEGLPIEEVRGLIHPDDVAAVVEAAQRTLTSDGPVDVHARYRRSDGAWRHALTRRVSQRDADGRTFAFLGVALDLTDQVEEQRLAAETAHRLDIAVAAAGIGVWSRDTTTEEAHWNSQMYRLWRPRPRPRSADARRVGRHPDAPGRPHAHAAGEAGHVRRGRPAGRTRVPASSGPTARCAGW